MDHCYYGVFFICLITIGLISDVKACGGNIKLGTGVISSPGFPHRLYPKNLNCVWTLHAPSMGRLKLNVTHFQLEASSACEYDNLKIWDNNTIIGTFCGERITNPIESRTSVLRIEFRTDGGTEKTGFHIHFKEIATRTRKLTPDEIRDLPNVVPAKNKLSKWLIGRRSNTKSIHRWGLQAPRIASNLYLNDKQLFDPYPLGKIEDELRYEIAIQVLDKASRIDKFSSQEIATFMNGLIVTCLNPRNFYGYDLVALLRRKVEAKNYTNPIEILALCIANDTMTLKDVEGLDLAYNSERNRPLWFDAQSFAVLALNCIMRKNKDLVDTISSLQNTMIQDLITKQVSNGTVGSFKDTALVLQALIAVNYSCENFNLKAAIDSLLSNQQADGSFGSFLNSYYILPVLNSKSLIDISSHHCQKPKMNEIETLEYLKRSRRSMLRTLLSVRIGSDTDLGKTWTLKVPENSSIYDAIELISSMDSKFKVEYSISDGKPYVSSVSGIEDDPELGHYWFTYVKISNSSMNANFVKRSPADVIIEENQELILWYREGI